MGDDPEVVHQKAATMIQEQPDGYDPTVDQADLRALRQQIHEMRQERARDQQELDVLRAERDYFQIIADGTYDWEYWRVPDGSYRYVSPACERITGYRPDAFQADPTLLEQIIHPDDREHVLRHLHERQQQQSYELEFRIVTRSGAVRWIGHACQPVYGRDGTWQGRRASNRDITAQKEAEEAYTLLVEHSLQALQIFQAGRIVFTNAAATHLTGYSQEEILALSPEAWPLLIHPDDRAELVQRSRDRLAGKPVSPRYECRFIHKDGTIRWIELLATPITYRGRPATHMAYIDITERKAAEEAYRTLVDNSLQALVIFQDGHNVFANPAAAHITGYTQEELLAMSPEEANQVVYPDDRVLLAERARQRQQGQDVPPRYEFRLIRKDGAVRWVECFNVLILYQNRPAVQMTYIDITERKETEEAYRTLVDNSLQGLVIFQDGRNMFANPAAAHITGYTQDELLAMSPAESAAAIHPDDRSMLVQRGKDRQAGKPIPQRYSFRIIRKDGCVRWLEAFAVQTFYQGRPAAQMAYMDITERKQAEEALHFQAQLLDSTGQSVIATTLDGTITYWNRAAEHLYGWAKHEVIGQNVLSMTLAQPVYAQPGEIIERIGQGKSWEGEFLARHRTGSTFPAWVTDVPFFDEQGQISGVIGVSMDITERKQAEEALRESEERYLRAVTAGKVGVWEWNLTTNEMYLAPHLKAMLGYADDEICNHLDDWGRFVHPDDQQLVMDAAAACLRGETDTYEVEHRMLHKDGSVRWMVARGLVSRDAQGHPVRMVGTDTNITERKRAEEQLHRANMLLKQQAIRDGLTGLHNRRYLDETLPRELQRAERQKQPVGIIMLDIDHFKRFNDTYGHDAGDTLLRAVGAVLQEHTRGDDIVCRYGGEEFMLVLPGASLAATQQRAEELRTEVQALMVEHGGQALAQVTVSLGVAGFPAHGTTADSLIRAADQALYQAKRGGRNRVEVGTIRHSEA
jgi:diguanylate cyclase (GGDEF)-like protein/PAS domain S-box-containing protein